MKISMRTLRRLIREEASDCLRDYRAGGLSYEDYQDCLRRNRDDYDDDYDDDYGYRKRKRYSYDYDYGY